MSAQAPVYNETRPARLWVRLAPSSIEKLDRYVEHQGITRAGLLHKIVRDWLEALPDEPDGPPVRSKRIYDRSEYMRQRLEARERAAAAVATERVLTRAQDNLQEHWSKTVQALEEVKQAVRGAAGAEEDGSGGKKPVHSRGERTG